MSEMPKPFTVREISDMAQSISDNGFQYEHNKQRLIKALRVSDLAQVSGGNVDNATGISAPQVSDEKRKAAIVDRYQRLKEAANYMIKEARFSNNMDAGIETAHAEILDHADALGQYALKAPAVQAVPREVVEFITSASKRSNYQWSEGSEYTALDHYNEGKIALSQRLLSLLGGKEG